MILEAKALKKYFPITKGLLFRRTVGWLRAVDGIDLSLEEGETVGLVGESGSGKTTVAKLLLQLERPTEGSVSFYGKAIHTLRGKEFLTYRRSVQAVFQDPYSSLDPRMTIGATIAEPLGGNIMKSSEVRLRVTQVLEDVGISTHNYHCYPHEFSGGQRQRIALARALASHPRCIILDEPVSALDVSTRAQILNLLKGLQDRFNHAYLLISHDLAVIKHMSNRIGVMYLGKLVETTFARELYSHPLHPYTQALLSAILPASLNLKKKRITLRGDVPSPLNVPSGCRFHTRCFLRASICSREEPRLTEIDSNHWVACWLYNVY